MTDFWQAFVASAAGIELVARISKLTTSSLTLRDAPGLATGDRVTVTFFSVSIDGVVVDNGDGTIDVAFEASKDVHARIVERIREVHGFVPPEEVDDSTTSSTPSPNPGLAKALTSPVAAATHRPERARVETVAERPPTVCDPFDETEDLPATEPGGVPPIVMDDEEEPTDEFPSSDLLDVHDVHDVQREAQHAQVDMPAVRRPRIVRRKSDARSRQITDLDPQTLIDDDDGDVDLTPRRRRAGGR